MVALCTGAKHPGIWEAVNVQIGPIGKDRLKEAVFELEAGIRIVLLRNSPEPADRELTQTVCLVFYSLAALQTLLSPLI